MRIDKSNEPTLMFLLDCNRRYKEYEKAMPSEYNRLFHDSRYSGYMSKSALQYCDANGIQVEDDGEAFKHFLQFAKRSTRKALNLNNVEFVSFRFEEEVRRTEQQLLDSVKGKSVFELIGECNGIMVLSDSVFIYSVSSEGCFFEYYNRFDSNFTGAEYYQFGSYDIGGTSNIHYSFPFLVLLFKRFAEIRTQVVAPRARRDSIDGNGMVINNLPFAIKQLDCTWFTNIVREEGFMVRGFWRLQACGVRHKEHKLIYIKPFEKKGYHRMAQKLKEPSAWQAA